MKKIIYIIILAIISGLSITSCTEETIAPNTQSPASGGAADEPIKRNS